MLRNYLKTAFKVFLRRKFFTAVSLFGISFTLLVLMVAASFLDYVFGPRAPETRNGRSLGIYVAVMSGENMRQEGPPGYKLLDKATRNLPGTEATTIHSLFQPAASYRDGEKTKLYLSHTDGEFFRVMQFNFLEGAGYSLEDDKNASFVAVINETTKRKMFGDAPAVGKTIEVDGQRFRVVGVVEDVSILRLSTFSDVWVPISTLRSDAYKQELVGMFWTTILAKSPDDFPAIREEVRRRVAAIPLPAADPLFPRSYTKLEAEAETFFEGFARLLFGFTSGKSAKLLGILIGVAVLFMVLPTLNLINLNVSRILERASEIGVRKSFGATSRTLVGQFVVENVTLCLVGGAIGLLLSALALQILNASGFVPYARFTMNLRVFAYGLAFSLFFGLLSGVYPAWKMSRLHPVEALKGGA